MKEKKDKKQKVKFRKNAKLIWKIQKKSEICGKTDKFR